MSERRGATIAAAGLSIAVLAAGAALADPSTTVLVTKSGTMLVTRNAGFLEMVGHADPVVKFVMLLLAAASVTTWTIWIGKTVELTRAKRTLNRDYGKLYAAESLKQAEAVEYPTIKSMVRVAEVEVKRGGAAPSWRAVQGMEERIASLLPVLESQAMHHMLRGTNLLASIGAVSPFVGLAGTVWGIMNSFLGISKSNSTSLAVVAPGIAEALLATAIGLAAAIPAVLIYNSLTRGIAGYRRLLNSAAQLIVCVMSREAEQLYAREHASGGAMDPVAGPDRLGDATQAPLNGTGRPTVVADRV